MEYINGAQFRDALQAAYESLLAHKEEVDELNVFPVPDGDTGTNMTMTMASAMEFVQKAKEDSVSAYAKALGNGTLMGARGNSGVIFSQLCRGISDALKGAQILNTKLAAKAFLSAKEKAYKAVMKPTEGTMLTVARGIAEFAERNADNPNLEDFLVGALQQASLTLQKTPEMLPALKEAGVVDAGGQGLVYLLTGFVEKLVDRDLSHLLEAESSPQNAMAISDFEKDSHQAQQFDYFLKVKVEGIEEERLVRHMNHHGHVEMVEHSGQALLVQASCDRPEDMLASILRRARILEMNLVHVDAKIYEPSGVTEEKEEKKARSKVGFVAVALGEGFKEVFNQLMVDEVVSGGQTMNPSTKELYDAVERVNADTVFILPNNKNIILAAEQVDELSSSKVIVIPSTSIPQGITALFHFDEDLSDEENREAMTESLESVITGQVTYAVRDTSLDGMIIKKDDKIGLIDGQIVLTGQDDKALVLDLLAKYVDADASLLTVYPGEGVKQEDQKELEKAISKTYSLLDVDVVYGGQPTYSYIFSIE